MGISKLISSESLRFVRFLVITLDLILNSATLSFMETDRHTKKLKLNNLGTTSGKKTPKLSFASGQGHCITFTVGGMLLLILSYFQNLLSYCVYYTASKV